MGMVGPLEVLFLICVLAGVTGFIGARRDGKSGRYRPVSRALRIGIGSTIVLISLLIVSVFLIEFPQQAGPGLIAIAWGRLIILSLVTLLATSVACLGGYLVGSIGVQRNASVEVMHGIEATEPTEETGNPYQPPSDR